MFSYYDSHGRDCRKISWFYNNNNKNQEFWWSGYSGWTQRSVTYANVIFNKYRGIMILLVKFDFCNWKMAILLCLYKLSNKHHI